jgi:hypothetical protein
MTAAECVMETVSEARSAVSKARCEARAMAYAYPPGDPMREAMRHVALRMEEALECVDDAVAPMGREASR